MYPPLVFLCAQHNITCTGSLPLISAYSGTKDRWSQMSCTGDVMLYTLIYIMQGYIHLISTLSSDGENAML